MLRYQIYISLKPEQEEGEKHRNLKKKCKLTKLHMATGISYESAATDRNWDTWTVIIRCVAIEEGLDLNLQVPDQIF